MGWLLLGTGGLLATGLAVLAARRRPGRLPDGVNDPSVRNRIAQNKDGLFGGWGGGWTPR